MGRLVTETIDFDGGRDVSVYLPQDTPEFIVFGGDGQLVAQWGADLESTDLPSTMIVGVHRAADETQRLHEYSAGFDLERFEAHEAFLIDEVRSWTATQFGVALPAQRTAALGVSAGAEWALALGLRHPDVFGTVFCASPGGGFRPPAALPIPIPRFYFVCGTREPFFYENAERWAVALSGAGADVVMIERGGSHGDSFWRAELALMVAWACPDHRLSDRRAI